MMASGHCAQPHWLVYGTHFRGACAKNVLVVEILAKRAGELCRVAVFVVAAMKLTQLQGRVRRLAAGEREQLDVVAIDAARSLNPFVDDRLEAHRIELEEPQELDAGFDEHR